MPGATTKYAFPYPLGTDPVSDGDDQIKALAEKVELVTNPATGVAVAYSANVTDVFEGCRVFKSGGLVVLRIAVSISVATTAGAVIIAVPAGYRPAATHRGVVWQQTGGTFMCATMLATGNMNFEGPTGAGASLAGTLVYPAA